MNWSKSAIELKKNGNRIIAVKKPLPEKEMEFKILNDGVLKDN